MSNSFLPKKAPDVLNQETLERVLLVLRQPFSIAVLVSLGLHGLLWAALPNMLAETEKEAETKQRVQVVELTPAEESRLPSLGINLIPKTLLPAKPANPAESGTKLPDPKLYNDPSLYTLPSLQPPPNIAFPSFGLPPLGLDFNQPPIKTPQKPAVTPKAPPEPPKAPTTPDASQTDNAPSGSTGEPTAPVRPEKLSPEQIAALRQEGARSSQLRALYTFNGPDTREKASAVFNANGAAFMDSAKKITGGEADDSRLYKAPEKVSGTVPKEACPYVRGVRNASFGVIVKPDGTLAEPPTVLLTSGFKGLDNAAIDDITSTVKNKKFGDGSRFQLIRFDFIFDPKSACSNPDQPA